MKPVRFLACSGMITGILLIAGCQAIFTFSPFSGLERDISDLSGEQKIHYAEKLLQTNETEKMSEAYDEIQLMLADDSDNTGLHLLAARLAIGASGINEVVSEALAGGDGFDVTTFLSLLDTGMLGNIDDHIIAIIDNGEEVNNEVLIIAASASILLAIEEGAAAAAALVQFDSWDPGTGPLSTGNDNIDNAALFILEMDTETDVKTELLDLFL